ncbi:DNA-binding protein [Saccharibacillus sp. CPCC 101409]|uniref:DNA-binding protein n=1 Tax=Saccharibacillus sp. CPCC 101409 TaxID=3058041 RepID=UPI002672F04F|nr:DNA-binding protein [Saccharibacillus sp. CPCC 101409]MDO3411207.1 DNA-binding protein [Saccharibacillus sp. CPCC 101409]
METTITLRSEIEAGITKLGMNFSAFSKHSGVNRGIFSAILNGHPPKPISLNQFELIIRALDCPEDWHFDLYIEECFYEGKPNRRRVEPFLIRCAELGRVDCIEEILNRLLEDLKHLEMIFEIAETLHSIGKVQESIIFYECVALNEKYQHSEKLAISRYRLFCAAAGADAEKSLRAAIEFEPYCERLPTHHRLDGLMRLINVYLSLDKKVEAERHSRELFNFSQLVYRQMEKALAKGTAETWEGRYPFVVYYGYGFLSMQNVMFFHRDYSKAKEYISGYADLSNFPGLDAEGQKEVAKFSFFARENRLNLELLAGNKGVLEECEDFIDQNPIELLVVLTFVLGSANRYGYSMDLLLSKFLPQIEIYDYENSYYNQANSFNFYIEICYESALYFLHRKEYEQALEYLLRGLKRIVKIKDKDAFIKFVPVFEKYKKWSSSVQQMCYEEVIGGLSEV